MSHVDRHSLAMLIRTKWRRHLMGSQNRGGTHVVPQVSRRQRDHSRQPSPGRPDDSANTDPVSVRHKLAKLTQRRWTTRTALHLLRKTFPRRTLHGWVAPLENPTKHARKKFQLDINSKKTDEDGHFPVPLCAQHHCDTKIRQ